MEECIVCDKEIRDDEELCDVCRTFYYKYPSHIREKILNYHRKLKGKEVGEDEEGTY